MVHSGDEDRHRSAEGRERAQFIGHLGAQRRQDPRVDMEFGVAVRVRLLAGRRVAVERMPVGAMCAAHAESPSSVRRVKMRSDG